MPRPEPEVVDGVAPTVRTRRHARTRRAELLAAITALERALAAPAGDPVWTARVQARTDQLANAFDDHVSATEGSDGMYAEILRTAPRLRFGVDRLATEHDDIRVAISALDKLIDDLTETEPGRRRTDPRRGCRPVGQAGSPSAARCRPRLRGVRPGHRRLRLTQSPEAAGRVRRLPFARDNTPYARGGLRGYRRQGHGARRGRRAGQPASQTSDALSVLARRSRQCGQ